MTLGDLDSRTAALLVIDLQNAFIHDVPKESWGRAGVLSVDHTEEKR